MPLHIIHTTRVSLENLTSIQSCAFSQFLNFIDVPEPDVLCRCEKKSILLCAPAQTPSFGLMTYQSYLRFACAGWRVRVHRPVKDQDVSATTDGGYDIRILRLVSSFVNLPVVVNLLRYLYASLLSASSTVTTDLPSLIIVFRQIDVRAPG